MWWEAVLFLQGMVRWCLGRILSQVMWLSAGILHRDKTHKGAGQSGGWCPFSGETLSLGGAVGLTFAQMRKSDGRTEWCNVTFCFFMFPTYRPKRKTHIGEGWRLDWDGSQVRLPGWSLHFQHLSGQMLVMERSAWSLGLWLTLCRSAVVFFMGAEPEELGGHLETRAAPSVDPTSD